MNHTWIWDGREYPFDISESECMERMCRALAVLREAVGGLGEKGISETIREQCRIIRGFFDAVLGDGTGVEICGEAYSADAHTTAYVEFILFVNEQIGAYRSKMEAVEARYMHRAAQSQGEAYGA